MQSNRFADALALLEAGSLDPEAVPAAVSRPLLHASLLTHLGRFEEADREATLVLDADPLNAGAHFVRGLCKEHAGALSEAEQHMTEATYLDPGFAMPQLYRGLLARRRQDVDAARTSFKRAVTALTAEDPDRLTIFAGNLSRQDLRQLCVRELERMRGL
jgi:chemotaxis protein methyltransferase CheR